MKIKNGRLYLWMMLTLFVTSEAFAQPAADGVGQAIRISTRLSSFVGRPSWLIEIRDIDHDQSIPYIYDINQNDNFWMALTYGRNYLITASTLQFSPYRANPYNTKVIHDFCHLESHGQIAHGESLEITLTGDLRPNSDRYNCNVTRFKDNNFTVTPSNSAE